MFDPPIYINVRDRVTCLRQLVTWLEDAGHQRIIMLDNDSTYEPLIEYLKATPHDVVCLGANYGSRALWHGVGAPNEWFVYTDPDILPIPECPHDAVTQLRLLLERHPWPKAGLGLYLGDWPEGLDRGIFEWESGSTIQGLIVESGARASLVDTTFALYRPGTAHTLTGLRTEGRYLARHLGWYSMVNPTDEDRYYVERAIAGPVGSSWAQVYRP